MGRYHGVVANKLILNTTDHPGLTQFLVNTREGIFDYKTQQAAGAVDVAAKNPLTKARLLSFKHPTTGLPYLKEI